MKRILSVAIAALLAGCCTVETCSEGGREMCWVRTSGWKLFNCVPLLSGNPDGKFCVLFEDTMKINTNIMLLDRTMRQNGYSRVSDLASFVDEETVLPLILKRVICHTSAEMIPPESLEL